MDAMDTVEVLSAQLNALPVAGLSRADAQSALVRLGRLREQLQEVERRLTGRLVTTGGGPSHRTPAEVLAQRLRISPGEAQRRIDAVTEGPSAA